MKNSRNKINEMITERIIEKIQTTGTLPWKKPWVSVSMMPRNLVTKKPYRGVNVFLLHMMGYGSPYWLSMNQVNQLGGKVRKGEKSCPVVFWKIVEPEDGDEDKNKRYAFLRYYRVFNTAQCEGIDHKIPKIEKVTRTHSPIKAAEEILCNMPNPPSMQIGCSQACYIPLFDRVCVPDPEDFISDENFYSACFHEMAHATGHQSRLNRKAITEPNGFGSHAYSQEELVAEMTATFLASECGILPAVEDNSTAYLSGWIDKLKADPSILIKAGSQAQKAYEFITQPKPATKPAEAKKASAQP